MFWQSWHVYAELKPALGLFSYFKASPPLEEIAAEALQPCFALLSFPVPRVGAVH